MIRPMIMDDRGNWIPQPPPKVIYDPDTDKFRYESGQSYFGQPVTEDTKFLIGTGPAWWEQPWFLNKPLKEQVDFFKAEIDRQIKAAKKSSRFDKFFGGFMSIFTKFIPYVGGLINRASQEGLQREIEKEIAGIKSRISAGKAGIESGIKRRQSGNRGATQPQISTRSRVSTPTPRFRRR